MAGVEPPEDRRLPGRRVDLADLDQVEREVTRVFGIGAGGGLAQTDGAEADRQGDMARRAAGPGVEVEADPPGLGPGGDGVVQARPPGAPAGERPVMMAAHQQMGVQAIGAGPSGRRAKSS